MSNKPAQPISISKANRATYDAIVEYRLSQLKKGKECNFSDAIFKIAAIGLNHLDETKENKLANALEKELQVLPEYNKVGEKNKKSNHADAIKYLRDGVKPKSYEDNDLLFGIIGDFSSICIEYGITKALES